MIRLQTLDARRLSENNNIEKDENSWKRQCGKAVQMTGNIKGDRNQRRTKLLMATRRHNNSNGRWGFPVDVPFDQGELASTPLFSPFFRINSYGGRSPRRAIVYV